MPAIHVFSDESELVARLRAGDDAAYTHLITTYGPRLLAVARRYLHEENDANDALQDAFISVFKAIDRFEGSSALSTWLHSIVVRACLMKPRTYRSREHVSIEDLLPKFEGNFDHHLNPSPAWRGTVEDNAESREVRELVRKGIDQLPEIYRVVLLLRDIEGMDTQEAANLLGLTTTVIKTRLHRARQALRGLLDPHLAQDAR